MRIKFVFGLIKLLGLKTAYAASQSFYDHIRNTHKNESNLLLDVGYGYGEFNADNIEWLDNAEKEALRRSEINISINQENKTISLLPNEHAVDKVSYFIVRINNRSKDKTPRKIEIVHTNNVEKSVINLETLENVDNCILFTITYSEEKPSYGIHIDFSDVSPKMLCINKKDDHEAKYEVHYHSKNRNLPKDTLFSVELDDDVEKIVSISFKRDGDVFPSFDSKIKKLISFLNGHLIRRDGTFSQRMEELAKLDRSETSRLEKLRNLLGDDGKDSIQTYSIISFDSPSSSSSSKQSTTSSVSESDDVLEETSKIVSVERKFVHGLKVAFLLNILLFREKHEKSLYCLEKCLGKVVVCHSSSSGKNKRLNRIRTICDIFIHSRNKSDYGKLGCILNLYDDFLYWDRNVYDVCRYDGDSSMKHFARAWGSSGSGDEEKDEEKEKKEEEERKKKAQRAKRTPKESSGEVLVIIGYGAGVVATGSAIGFLFWYFF